MVQAVDGKTLAAMLIHASASLDAEKQKINELNVFPVPDGDTGTNMTLTIGAAAQDMKKKQHEGWARRPTPPPPPCCGAPGDSGVILSLLFRGFAKAVRDKTTMDGADLAMALDVWRGRRL